MNFGISEVNNRLNNKNCNKIKCICKNITYYRFLFSPRYDYSECLLHCWLSNSVIMISVVEIIFQLSYSTQYNVIKIKTKIKLKIYARRGLYGTLMYIWTNVKITKSVKITIILIFFLKTTLRFNRLRIWPTVYIIRASSFFL